MKSAKHTKSPELPWSWHKSQGWEGQLLRVQRWLDRLTKIQDIDEAEDFLYSYFQNCYHLRDWLLSESVVPQIDIEQLFAKYPELRISGDICNATKHLRLDSPKQPREFSMAREYCGPSGGRFGATKSETFVILSDGIKYEAFDLAQRTLTIWLSFLHEHKISVTPVAAP